MIVEVPIEVERVVEKAVKVVEYQEKLVDTVSVVEKIVQVQVEKKEVTPVERIRDKLVVTNNPQVVVQDKVVIQEKPV